MTLTRKSTYSSSENKCSISCLFFNIVYTLRRRGFILFDLSNSVIYLFRPWYLFIQPVIFALIQTAYSKMSGLKKRKCEICKIKTCTIDSQKAVFMAKFPLEANRCRQWVAATGNKHLINVPIEKLNQLKYVCGKHFRPKDFKRKKTQLKKHAVPIIDVSENPLPDDLFHNFPLHIKHVPRNSKNNVLRDHNYYRRTDQGIKDSSSNEGTSEPPVERPMGETSEEVCTQPMDLNKQTNEPDLDALGSPSPSHSDVPEPEPMAFSWQNTEHIIVEKDNLDTDNIQPNENAPDSMQDEKCHKTLTEATREEEYRKEKHTGFSCDYCLGDIVGFRYTCIQCENFDLCAACESRLVHPLHYMLRVSMPKPYNEVRRVITAIRDKLAKLEEDFRQCSVLFDDVLIKKEEDPLVEESVEPLPSVLGEAVQPETVPNVDDSLYGISEEPNTFWLSSKHTTLQNEDCGRSSEDHYVDGSQHRREEPFIKKEYEEEELLDGTWFGESDKDNNRKRRIIVVNKFQRGKMRKPVKSKDVCVNEGRPEQSY
ncbi:uncharacterized protein LOC106143482 isoform X2 [Amyelois transitella]|uniref:uncharacterized protein LOC106143482 isoform X2 n=1 Tax=Amyelois transitella TaxID=680683 RepID=UPI00298F72E5|nr:uncharacterized protein LOC106143482 isoform X2 [Amyelois transitella]